MVILEPETAADQPAIGNLLDLCFGPGRYAKTAYRFREGVAPVKALCFVARSASQITGSLRFWPVVLGGAEGLLLGPLAVVPTLRGQGIGIGLMVRGLTAARRLGYPWVMLVGDEPYYARVGFRGAEPGRFVFPGPVDPARLLVRELVPGSLASMAGRVLPALPAFAVPGKAEEAGDQKKRHGQRQKRAL